MVSKTSSGFDSNSIDGTSRQVSPQPSRLFGHQSIKPTIGKYEILDKDHRRQTISLGKQVGESIQSLRAHPNTEEDGSGDDLLAARDVRYISHEKPAPKTVMSQHDSVRLEPPPGTSHAVGTVFDHPTKDATDLENDSIVRGTASQFATSDVDADVDPDVCSTAAAHNQLPTEVLFGDSPQANTIYDRYVPTDVLSNIPAMNVNINSRNSASKQTNLPVPNPTTATMASGISESRRASSPNPLNPEDTVSRNVSTQSYTDRIHCTSNTMERALSDSEPSMNESPFTEAAQISVRRRSLYEKDTAQIMDQTYSGDHGLSQRGIGPLHSNIIGSRRVRQTAAQQNGTE